jgi:hypothetical protein
MFFRKTLLRKMIVGKMLLGRWFSERRSSLNCFWKGAFHKDDEILDRPRFVLASFLREADARRFRLSVQKPKAYKRYAFREMKSLRAPSKVLGIHSHDGRPLAWCHKHGIHGPLHKVICLHCTSTKNVVRTKLFESAPA